jgi:tetratricopeptide (TPR) repeat protein
MGIPSALTERIRAGQGVLVAGLGFFSTPATRGWELLLRRLAERFASGGGTDKREAARTILDLVNRGRYGAAVAWLRQRVPDEAFRQVLAEQQGGGGKPPESLSLAARLPWRGVVATFFPELWDKTLKNGRARRLDARVLAERERLEDGVSPFVLNALGSFAEPGSLAVSAAELRRRPGMDAVAGFLRSLYADRSFVFLGFRPGDPDLRLLVDNLLGAAPTRAEHYLLLADNDAGDADLQTEIAGAELGLTPVAYAGTLEELLGMWAGVPEPVDSEAHSDSTTAEIRLEDGTRKDGRDGGRKQGRDGGRKQGRDGVRKDGANGEPDGRGDPLSKSGLIDWVREQHANIEATPPLERAALYERMGDVFRERLRNPVQAISYFRSALEHDPGRRSVLVKLSDLYRTHKHWAGAEETLVKLAEVEPTADRRAQLLSQAAAIALDELDRPVRAAQLLERALDEAPELPATFETLERLLNQEKNWQALARLYQKMARELDADGPGRALKLRAMDGLAELALRFSKDPKVALRALEAADTLDPANPDRKALMAGLYAQAGPDQHVRAVAMHHAAIAADPDRFTSYRALAELYRAAGDRDRLWCVAATMSFLRKADDELREIYERGRAARLGPLTQPFGPEVWARVAHPDEDRDFSALFAVLGPVLAGVKASTPEGLGLRPEERVGAAFNDGPVGRALALVAHALDSPKLQVFQRPGDRRPVTLRIVRLGHDFVPALVLSGPLAGQAHAHAHVDIGEATFSLARALVMLRPERMVCAVEAGRAVARVGLEAALHMAGLKAPSEALRGEVERMTAELGTLLPPTTRDHIIAGARRLIAKHGGAFPDVDRWCNAVELSAARAAFLLVNDLVVSARALAAEAGAQGSLSVKQRLKDLVAFSISESYFEARGLLGLG